MLNTNFRTFPTPDAQALDALVAVMTETSTNAEQIRINVNAVGQASELTPQTINEQGFVRLARENRTAVWSRIDCRFPIRSGRASIAFVRDDMQPDRLDVSLPDNTDINEASVLLFSLQRRLPVFNRPSAMESAVGPELAEFYRKREEALTRLEAIGQKIIEDTAEYRKSLDDRLEAARRALEDELAARTSKLQAEFEANQSALQQREHALDARQREVDDRSARHARRQLRQDLKKKIAESGSEFSLSKGTATKRRAVHVIFIALLAMSAAVAINGLFFPQESQNPWVMTYQLLRAPLGLVGFALSAVFYIRWNDNWFRQHADEEFRLKHLELDVDRASWVMEMLLEWQEDKGSALPTALVDRLTANLFDDRSSERLRHPSEDLASALIGASSGLRVSMPAGAGTIEATVNRKGVEQLQKSLDASAR